MKPVPGLDPPEYESWTEDPRILREFEEAAVRDPERAAVLREVGERQRLGFYEGLVRNRLHDLQLKRWVRLGVLSKAWLGPGEEAVTIGACRALEPGDVVAPMIRNAGAAHERGMTLAAMFRGALGSGDGPAGGRDLHFGDPERGVVAPISMVGSLVPVAAGMALAFRLRGESRIALTWVGDGSVATAGFHEGLAAAAGLGAPLVVVIQNNRIALGTPLGEEGPARLRAAGGLYGAPLAEVEGNNVLEVFAAVALARRRALETGAPALVLAHTFRMGGHATHDEGLSRRILPAEHFDFYGRRDPVRVFGAFLRRGSPGGEGLGWPAVAAGRIEEIERRVGEEAREAEAEALDSHRRRRPDPEAARAGVFGQVSRRFSEAPEARASPGELSLPTCADGPRPGSGSGSAAPPPDRSGRRSPRR